MDDTEKTMSYAYLAQSMYNQMMILENVCKNNSEIEKYLALSHTIGNYFSQLSQNSGEKVENNVKNSDKSGGITHIIA